MRPGILSLLLFIACAVSIVLLGGPAFAQDVVVTSNVDANEVELGDTVTYTLEASSSTGEPVSDPRLANTQGFTIIDQRAGPTHMVSIINGRVTEKRGLNASWTLRAERLGTFLIGPASVAVGNARRNAPAQRVNVVAPGQGRPKPRRGPKPFDPFGGSPFDPFGGLFPSIPGIDDDRTDPFFQAVPETDPKLALDSPRGPIAFLHATVDKTRAVVGEQVTLTVYLYEDPRARQGRPYDVHEATATHFLKRSLLKDETRAIHVGHALVGGRPWAVKLVRKNALFPLKTGRLTIEPMSLSLSNAPNGKRESETLHVDVTEPPLANRPAGYQMGDTGDFSLSSEVTPRDVDQHGAVGVTVELRGTGNIPSSLPTPEVAGVEWLEPQTRDDLGPVSNDRFGGTRTFSYVVRLHKDGAIDLGEIRLPYYDPRTRSYHVARTSLGIVQVAPSQGRDAAPEVVEEILPGLPAPRAALEGRRAQTYLTERPLYWGAVFGAPLACAVGIALFGAVARLHERRANKAPSPERIAKERRAEAEAALKDADGKAAVAAIARFLEAEIIARTGVNVRGTSGQGAVAELTDAGAPAEAAKEAVDVLAACEDARFAPDASGGVSMDDARALFARAKAAAAALDETDRSSVPPPKGSG
jgi:hypothetical protein